MGASAVKLVQWNGEVNDTGHDRTARAEVNGEVNERGHDRTARAEVKE